MVFAKDLTHCFMLYNKPNKCVAMDSNFKFQFSKTMGAFVLGS